jgi:hypothetical protein
MSFYQDYLKKQDPSQPEKPSPEKRLDSSLSQEEIERKKFLEKIYKEKPIVENVPPTSSPQPEIHEKISLPPVQTKPQKIMIRILVLFLFLALASGLSALAWWWAIKTEKIVTEVITEIKEVVVEIPEVEAPVSFLNYDWFLEPIVTHIDEIPKHLKQIAKEEHEKNFLVKIAIKDHSEKNNPSYVDLKSFFSSMKISPPHGFYEKTVPENFNAFLYSGDQNDLGFIVSIVPGALNEFLGIVMGSWDPSFEKDFKGFYSLVQDKEEPAVSSSIVRQTTIRCKNFNENSQLCYAVREEKFLMTTSLESAQIAITKLR